MCLILVAWKTHPEFPLVVAANRDEFYTRPSAPAAPWEDAPNLLGGRDIEAGGTWLAATTTGRFAAVTNVREPGTPPGQHSRGMLTADFLRGTLSPLAYATQLRGEEFSGFNLIVAGQNQLCYWSNRGGPARLLAPGIYGISNHLLDTPWPKLETAKRRFTAALAHLPSTEEFFALLADAEIVADPLLPQTGVSLEWERRLSAIFVQSADYGTRASTVLTQDLRGGIDLEEHCFGPNGVPLESSRILGSA